MKVTSKVYQSKVKAIDKAMQTALIKAVDAARTDLQQSQTMPFRTGALQNRSTTVDRSNAAQGRVLLVSDTPYARRIYFHPEYNFRKDKNPYAQALWLKTYVEGAKKEFIRDAFARFLSQSKEV